MHLSPVGGAQRLLKKSRKLSELPFAPVVKNSSHPDRSKINNQADL